MRLCNPVFRPIALLVAAAYLTACSSWQMTPVPADQYVNQRHPDRILVVLSDNFAYVIGDPVIIEGELQGKQLKKGRYRPVFEDFEWYRHDPFFERDGNKSAGRMSKSIPLKSIRRVEVWQADGELTSRRVEMVALGIVVVAVVAGFAFLIAFASDPMFE